AGKHYASRLIIAISAIVMSLVIISTSVMRFVSAESQGGISATGRFDETTQGDQKESEISAGRGSTPGLKVTKTIAAQDDFPLRQQPSPTPVKQPGDPSAIATQDALTTEQIFGSFSQEERARLISNGIGPAYLEEMGEAGYHQLSVAQLIALFSNGVRAKYV